MQDDGLEGFQEPAQEPAQQDEQEREREQQQAAKLLECEKLFTQPDSIMEPGILEVLRRYLELGGSAQNGVDFLIDKYVGYAQMASLVCSWMAKAESHIQQPGGIEVTDQVQHMQALIADRFDPDKVDSLLRTRKGPPKWLTPLIADRSGRELIYTLSARYKNCQLLKYAMQRILMAGHDEEVAAVGSRLAGYFEVFHNLMVKRLEEMLHASEERMPALARDLMDICCGSQHTYAHAQQLLHALGSSPQGGRFRRLSQDMETYAAEQQGHPIAWKMHQLFMDSSSSAADAEVAVLVADLLSVDRNHTRSLLPKLHRLYCAPADSSQVPPLKLIRHPKVFQILTSGLFEPSQSLPEDTQRVYIQLLATAAAAVDSRTEGGTLNTTDVPAYESALQAAMGLAKQAAAGDRFTPSQLQAASGVLKVPCAAMGLLLCMQHTLQDRRMWSGALEMLPAPAFLALMLVVVPLQPQMGPKIVEIIAIALKAMGSKTDYASGFLDLCVYQMQQGCIEPVLRMVAKWAASGSADPLLIKHFVFKTLAVCGPPYSAHFAAALLRVMLRGDFKRGRVQDSTEVRLLQQFWSSASSLLFQPPLGNQEAALLQQLSSMR